MPWVVWNKANWNYLEFWRQLSESIVLNNMRTRYNTLEYLTSKNISKHHPSIAQWLKLRIIRLFGKCLSFANVFFTTMQLHTNVKPSLWNVALFISTEQNGLYVIRENNIKQKRCTSIISSYYERNFSDNLILRIISHKREKQEADDSHSV